jgi:hypothetical protein
MNPLDQEKAEALAAIRGSWPAIAILIASGAGLLVAAALRSALLALIQEPFFIASLTWYACAAFRLRKAVRRLERHQVTTEEGA